MDNRARVKGNGADGRHSGATWVLSGLALLLCGTGIAGSEGWVSWVLVALVLPVLVGILWRRSLPLLLWATACAMTALGSPAILLLAMGLVALHSTAWITMGAASVAFVIVSIFIGPESQFVAINIGDADTLRGPAAVLANSLLVVVVPALIGTSLRVRRQLLEHYRERAERAEAERHLRAREAVLSERARISREAHDAIGHKLSLLTLQAGALGVSAEGASHTEVQRQADLIRSSARAALEELRTLIGTLDGDRLDHDSPAPGQAGPVAAAAGSLSEDVTELVALHHASGVDVTVATMPDLGALAPDLRHTALRVVQECLTNAVRHGAGAITLTLDGRPGECLDVTVRNAIKITDDGSEPTEAGGGRGLSGLTERVRRLGGRLVVVSDTAFFMVRAHLLWPATAAMYTNRLTTEGPP